MNSLFYFFSFLILGFSLLVVTSKNLLHCAMALIGTLATTAALYILLQAEFVAVSQVMVYIGGVVIFIVFAILLTTRLGETVTSNRRGTKVVSAVISGLLFSCFFFYFKEHIFPVVSVGANDSTAGSITAVGTHFLDTSKTGFIVPFEVVSILLLTVVIGAITIARKEEDGVNQ